MSPDIDIERILARNPFFAGITPASRRALSRIVIPRHLEKGEAVFHEGQSGHSLCILCYGAVRLYKSTDGGKDTVIKLVNPGEMFAEVILFEEKKYPVSAMAVQDSLILLLPRHQIHCLLNEHAFRDDFIAMLMRKQRHLTRRIQHLTAESVEQRFFTFLREQYGEKAAYAIPLSKKEIASAIGVNPETFSRLLNRLKRDLGLSWRNGVLSMPAGFWESRESEVS
jgi:CRP/FNR family transcriptional regulator